MSAYVAIEYGTLVTKCKFSSPEVMCDSVKRIFMIDLECSKMNFIPLFVVPAGKMLYHFKDAYGLRMAKLEMK